MTTRNQGWIVVVLSALLVLGHSPAAEIKTLVTNGLIMTMEPGQEEAFTGYLALDAEGKILEVGKGTAPSTLKAAKTIDATGKFILPGILSGHSHLWQSAFRGIASDQELWGWLELLHRTYGPFFGKGDFYAFTEHGALDYLRHGITTCYNWSTSLGQPEDLYLEQLDAEAAAGERFVFGYGLNATMKLEDNRKNVQNFLARSKALESNPIYLGPSLSGQGAMRNPDG